MTIPPLYSIKCSILILSLLLLLNPNVLAVAAIDITQLTYGTEIRDCGNPAWSPDGTKIAYSAGSANSNNSIWVMNANGSNPVQLTKPDINNPVHRTSTQWVDRMPRWSSDGSKIVFQRSYYDDGGGYEGFFVYIINADGSNQKMLISGQDPSISPDGQYIAFDAGIAGDIKVTAEQGLGIYVMNIEGTNVKILTENIGNEVAPSWSPDDKKIVFSKNGIIHIMDADGSNMTSTGQSGYYARWSPDGKRIAFLSERAGDIFRKTKLDHIYVTDIDGTNLTQLTFGDKRWDGLLDWSPDGTKIIFDSAVPTAPTSISNIYIMTLDFNATMPTPSPTAVPTITATQTPAVTPTATRTPKVSGFSLLLALTSLSLLVLAKRIK